MKGAWRTIEAVIAGVVILLFAAALGSTQSIVKSSPPVHGYRALGAVYEKGMLRTYAAHMDFSAIDSEVADTGYLTGFNHTVQICGASGSCAGQVPSSDELWVSRMLLSGDETYEPLEVILYIYR